jgi:predicted nucleic acid-binding protein
LKLEAHSKELSQSKLERAAATEVLEQLTQEYDNHQAKLEASSLSINELTQQKNMFTSLLDKLDRGEASPSLRDALKPKTDQLGSLHFIQFIQTYNLLYLLPL